MPKIKAIAMDVDGVLTDGSVWWGPNGEEWKRLHFADIMGLSLARQAGLAIALISGEDTPIVDRLATKMDIKNVYKNCKQKALALRQFAKSCGASLEEICFIGDDVNDLPALAVAGMSACPCDARPVVRDKCQVVATLAGGNGAVREIIDSLLAARSAAANGSR